MSQPMKKTICLPMPKASNLNATVKKWIKNKDKGIQCHECKDFGYSGGCTNIFRKENKGYTTTFSDDELDEETEKANNVVSFTSCVRSKSIMHYDGESGDEDLSDDDLVGAFNLIYLNWK